MENQESQNYFNFSNNKILFDEKKKRFIYLKGAKKQHRKLFNKSYFKSQRPDIIDQASEEWNEDFRDGQAYMRAMLYYNKLEMKRLWRTLQTNAYPYVYTIMDDYLKQHRIDNPRVNRLWTWRDSSKMVDYIREHRRRIEKYGLNNSATNLETSYVSKEQLKQREDDLVEYFLHEMRKKPVE